MKTHRKHESPKHEHISETRTSSENTRKHEKTSPKHNTNLQKLKNIAELRISETDTIFRNTRKHRRITKLQKLLLSPPSSAGSHPCYWVFSVHRRRDAPARSEREGSRRPILRQFVACRRRSKRNMVERPMVVVIEEVLGPDAFLNGL